MIDCPSNIENVSGKNDMQLLTKLPPIDLADIDARSECPEDR